VGSETPHNGGFEEAQVDIEDVEIMLGYKNRGERIP
jgi:hypothetical protein